METSKGCCFFHVHIGKSLAKAFLYDFLGPTLWAPCSEQTVCSPFCPFNIICLKHIFSLLVQSGSYFMHQQSLWVNVLWPLSFIVKGQGHIFKTIYSLPLTSFWLTLHTNCAFLAPLSPNYSITQLGTRLNFCINLGSKLGIEAEYWFEESWWRLGQYRLCKWPGTKLLGQR